MYDLQSVFVKGSPNMNQKEELRMKIRYRLGLVLAVILSLCLSACGTTNTAQTETVNTPAAQETEAAPPEQNGEVYVLFTSDVHCGIEQGFGYVGLQQVRDALEAKGFVTILVDDGDAIQGEALGTLSKGESMIDLMNALHYDVAIPGNHEFDYGMERFLELAEKAEFPYISCNFNHEGELVFPPYVIKEAAGMKIAFVGVTTPQTITSSTPVYFQNDAGEFVYGFMQDASGEALYAAVQGAVDAARAEGADLVYVMGHMGMGESYRPYSYADVLENTNGINVFLDGHSHDTEQVEMKNKDGETVVRSACGTKLNCIGYSHISAEKEVVETGIWSWPNGTSAPELLSLQNAMTEPVAAETREIEEQLSQVVARNDVLLTINDPVEVTPSGSPVRMVRRAETNLGDLCADALRVVADADIALVNGGNVRKNLEKGDITYGDILAVHPFGNEICLIRATGQQILDALEWGVHSTPDEFGGFLQVSGMSYEVDLSVPSGCKTDEQNMVIGIEGERRVRNVLVGGEPIDPAALYTVAGANYTLLQNGDGFTAFNGAELLQECVMIDNQLLIDYIKEHLNGEIGGEYADSLGQGRITILNGSAE